METKLADSSQRPLVGAGVDRRGLGQTVMEAGIEHRDLRYGAAFFFDQPDSFEFNAIVQRCKNGHLFDGRFNFWVIRVGRRMFPSSVYDAVSDGMDLRKPSKNAASPETRAWRSCAVAAARSPRFRSCFDTLPDGVRTSRVARFSRHSILPSQKGFGGTSGSGSLRSKEAGPLAARSRVEHQNFHLVRPFPVPDFGEVVAMFAYVLLMVDRPGHPRPPRRRHPRC